MVEGHSVHRIASRFRNRLVGRRFAASSPNERFVDGSDAIDGRVMSNIEAVGKNLFAFFSPPKPPALARSGSGSGSRSTGSEWKRGDADDGTVVVHVHFGMSGAWSLHDASEEPEVRKTTRLRLLELPPTPASGSAEDIPSTAQTGLVVAHLSAMTCQHGTYDLYATKRSSLGHDPLRPDADPDDLYRRVSASSKSIGKLLMDQSYFAGPGNIYRAEILFLAGVHPNTPGSSLDRSTFDRVWQSSVRLLRRGYDTGSILTVDAEIDPDVVRRGERRYIYNRSNCARCGGPVRSWDVAGRTCYACAGGLCQPRIGHSSAGSCDVIDARGENGLSSEGGRKGGKKRWPAVAKSEETTGRQHRPFVSHCAPDGYQKRLAERGPAGLTIAEIRAEIKKLTGGEVGMPPKGARKAAYVEALGVLLGDGQNATPEKEQEEGATTTVAPATKRTKILDQCSSSALPLPTVSAEDAAREKAAAGEGRGVEHVAELSREQSIEAASATAASVAAAAVVTPLPEEAKNNDGCGGGSSGEEPRRCPTDSKMVSSESQSRKSTRVRRKRKLDF